MSDLTGNTGLQESSSASLEWLLILGALTVSLIVVFAARYQEKYGEK